MSVFVQVLLADEKGGESALRLEPIDHEHGHGGKTAELRAGARVAITARIAAPTYLYVIHYDSRKPPEILYPSGGDKRVQKKITIRVPPAEQYLVLDANPAGDFIVVVATDEPMDTADPKLRSRLHLTGRRAFNPPPVGGGPRGRGDGLTLVADEHGIAIGRIFLARAGGRAVRKRP